MKYNTTQMSVAQIRELLINQFNYTQDDVNNIKGKSNLVNELKKATNLQQAITIGEIMSQSNESNQANDNSDDEFSIVETEPIDTYDTNVPQALVLPNTDVVLQYMLNDEWNDYVMGLFTDDELIAIPNNDMKNPTVDGLRRVTDILFGIRSIETDIKQVPDRNNDRCATVVVTVTLENDQKYCGAADADNNNSAPPYNLHPVSLAETRAEGRALKRALKLRRVIAVEELNIGGNMSNIDSTSQKITDVQIEFIKKMCEPDRLNINLDALLQSNGYSLDKITSVTYNDAQNLMSTLNIYQQSKDTIPQDILNTTTKE